MNVEFRMNRGFSIIEIIVVVVVIGIMLAVALPKYNRVVEKSRQAEAFTNLAAIRGAQMRHYAEKGEWASDFDDLDAEEPEDTEQYFDYFTGEPELSPNSDDTIAWAQRKTDVKNCCFGDYMVFISTSGKISKQSASASEYASAP